MYHARQTKDRDLLQVYLNFLNRLIIAQGAVMRIRDSERIVRQLGILLSPYLLRGHISSGQCPEMWYLGFMQHLIRLLSF